MAPTQRFGRRGEGARNVRGNSFEIATAPNIFGLVPKDDHNIRSCGAFEQSPRKEIAGEGNPWEMGLSSELASLGHQAIPAASLSGFSQDILT